MYSNNHVMGFIVFFIGRNLLLLMIHGVVLYLWHEAYRMGTVYMIYETHVLLQSRTGSECHILDAISSSKPVPTGHLNSPTEYICI